MQGKFNYSNLIINFALSLFAIFFFLLASIYDQIHKSPTQIFEAIFNYDFHNSAHLAIRARLLKLSAMILAIISISIGGLLIQTISRNPLASPGVIGMMGSIKLGATILSFFGITFSLISKQFILMIFGALPIAILLTIIKFSRLKISGITMIFVGIALGVIFSSIEWFALYNNEDSASFVSTFLSSNFTLLTKSNLLILSLFIMMPVLLTFIFARKFTILSTGDDLSTSTGNNANHVRLMAMALVIIMVPAAVLLGGNLLFAGIIAPNIAKLLIRNRKFFPTLIATIFIGISIIMCTAIIESFISLNISALLNIVAAPIFIFIARRVND